MREYVSIILTGVLVLAAMIAGALLLVGCGEALHVVAAPPGEDMALAIAASVYGEGGEPVQDIPAVSVTWYSNMCLAEYKVDTEHWTLRDACVHGVALGCHLQVVKPMGDAGVLSRSSLAHELYHCQGYQAGGLEGLDIEHKREGWKTLVPLARQRIAEAGL